MEPGCHVPYFPVFEQYQVPGDLYPLGAAGAGHKIIEVDERRELFLEHKRHLNDSGLLPLRFHPADIAAERAAADWLATAIRNELPEPLLPDPMPTELDDLVVLLQEDVVVLRDIPHHQDPRKRLTPVYVNVSHPSGWCPQCIPGKNFAWIHRHVAGFSVADQRSNLAALLGNDPWIRFVWTVAPDAALDRRKCEDIATHAQSTQHWDIVSSLESLYFRVERQVLVRLAREEGDIVVFLIRIFHDPITRLQPGQRQTVACALDSMDEAVARYKGLWSRREQIIEWLRT